MNYVGVTEEDCMSSVLSEIRLRRLDSVMHKRRMRNLKNKSPVQNDVMDE